MLVLYLMFGVLHSCGSTDQDIHQDPANLSVEIIISNDRSGIVDILASADYCVEFQLFIDGEDLAADTNQTGIFRHTFIRSGNHLIEVRAYGLSGRYLKETRSFQVMAGDIITPDDGYKTPLEYPGYDLVWNDEFEGASVNEQNWSFETGNGCPQLCGWGNNELQYYRRENARVGEGVLTIEARKESIQGFSYSSARMITRNLRSFKYGRIDIRALLPTGQGIWPALWMLGNNISSVGWPACGEIDIMEMIGGSGRENSVHGTIHWDYQGTHAQYGGSRTLSTGTYADEYHVFSIIWDTSSIRWYVNDQHFVTADILPESMGAFHREFFFIFNLAVGGNWPGNPNSQTQFPQSMKVDYIRVFQKQ